MDAAGRTQTRLFILVLLAFLPAVGLFWYASTTLEGHELSQRESELLGAALVAHHEYQSLISESEHFLATLAQFPEIATGRGACNERLAAVLQQVPQYTTISLIGIDGYLACGSLTLDGGLYLGDRYYFTGAMSTNRFTIGEYAVGRITGKPTVGVALPILNAAGTEPAAVLATSIDLSTLAESALEMSLPKTATFTILDRNRRVLVRIPEGRDPLGRDTVGATAPETYPDLPVGAAEPFLVSGEDLDGVRRLFAAAPLRGRGARAEGHLVVGLEEYMLLSDAQAVSSNQMRFLAMAGIIVLILAWLFGHYALVRPGQE